MPRVALRAREVKQLLLGLAGAIVVIAGLGVYLARDALRERWWIYRLTSANAGVRASVAWQLGSVGSERAAQALIDRMADGGSLGPEAVAALRSILERVGPETKLWIVRRVLELIRANDQAASRASFPAKDIHVHDTYAAWYGNAADPEQRQHLEELLAHAAAEEQATLPAFVETLEKQSPQTHFVAALAASWPGAEAGVEAWLARAAPAQVEAFLGSLRSILSGVDVKSMAPDQQKLYSRARAHVRRILIQLAETHPRPEVRVRTLVKTVFTRMEVDAGPHMDTERIAIAYAHDPDPLVKSTALKLAGLLDREKGNLDLKAIIRDEKDPKLLATAIQARTLAASDLPVGRILLAPGVVTELPSDGGVPVMSPRPLDVEEVQRLEAILREATDPLVRDAASCALVTSREEAREADDTVPPPRLKHLKVHEWGVWKDGGGSFLPSREALVDLPPFVHRTRVGPEDLLGRGAQYIQFTVSFKPVVFFHSPEPVTLLVRVGFLGGVPWTRYPDATDIAGRGSWGEVASRLHSFLDGASIPDLPPDPGGKAYWQDKLNPTTPPGAGEQGNEAAQAELLSFHEGVPWVPHSNFDVDHLRGFCLEWRGLRLGYGPRLEGELRQLPSDAPESWWARLRGVPSTPVALRGDHEGFLFYDGPILAPSPVVAEWADATRRAHLCRSKSGTTGSSSASRRTSTP